MSITCPQRVHLLTLLYGIVSPTAEEKRRMLTRITITLSIKEREALSQLAKRDFRGLKEHIRYILRQEVERQSVQVLARDTSSTTQAAG